MTDHTAKTVDSVVSTLNNPLVSDIASLIIDDKTAFIKEHISFIEWALGDILKGKNETDVVLSFYYSETISGAIRIIMIKENNEWKIDRIGMPTFD